MSIEKQYEHIESQVLHKLRHGLSDSLYYHGLHHTIDVMMQAERIANDENILSTDDILLLKIGALYHDIGFLFSYYGHEETGCEIVKEELQMFNLDDDHIDITCGLIMATKIPQTPLNKLEEIICDADLDYLGRDDFFEISETLFLELKVRDMVNSKRDWNLIQINFIGQHQYYTETNKQLRQQKKLKHLEMIKAMI